MGRVEAADLVVHGEHGLLGWADPMLSDHLQAFGDIHEHAGFHAFQSMVASLSFQPDYYNANREKLLGSGGVWVRSRDASKRTCALCGLPRA